MIIRTIQKLVLITLFTLSISVSADEKIDWTGFYGSAMVGRDWGHVSEGGGHSTFTSPDYYPGYIYETSLFSHDGSSFRGWSGNLKLGYNKQINENVFGIEAGAVIQSTRANGNAIETWDTIPAAFEGPTTDSPSGLLSKTKIKNYETLNLRAGHLFDNKTLIYGTAGVALGEIKRTLYQSDVALARWLDNSASDKKTEIGYAIGFGLEHRLTERLSLRADYQYIDFGKMTFKYQGDFHDLIDPFPQTNTISQSNSIHFSNLSAGVSYAF